MAEDQVDNKAEGGRSFGEVTERDYTGDEGETPTLAKDTVVETEDESTTGEETQTEDTQVEGEGESVDANKEGEEPELTEKGTKLDPNPQSRVHQQLANETKLRNQMQTVLGDPKLLAQFVKQQYGLDMPVPGAATADTSQETTETKEFKAEDFENLDDVASKFNEMQKGFAESNKAKDAKIAELESKVSSLIDGGQRARIASNIGQGVDNLKKLPELSPNNPEYIDGLEEMITEQYNKLDFDPNTGSYRGNYSIEEIGRGIIQAIQLGKKAGSKKTQTIVKDKTGGQIRTSSKIDDEVDTSKMSPENSIAYGISKMFK